MNKTILATAGIFAMLAVIFGALGAHALKAQLSESALDSFKTGVAYQMYHALFLLVLGSVNTIGEKGRKTVFYLITAGIFCFSFSIYALTMGPLAGMDFSRIGWITPVGGALFIAGWALFIYRVFRGLD